MANERDSEKQKEQREPPECKNADPSAHQEADQAAAASSSGSGSSSSKTTSETRAKANTTTTQAITTDQAHGTVTNNAATRDHATTAQNNAHATTNRTPLPFWGRPHPTFGTAADPADRLRREARAWIPLGRPPRGTYTRERDYSEFEDEQEDDEQGNRQGKGAQRGPRGSP